MSRIKGRVKWWSDAKGFGFITPDDGTTDVFVHFSGIRGKGHRSLEDGQIVEFEVVRGEKGDQASDVAAAWGSSAPRPSS